MKRSIILWTSAFLLTFLTAYIQSCTDKYNPVTGAITIDGKNVSYRFDKIYKDKGDYRLLIRTDSPDIQAAFKWKKENENEWKSVEMKKNEEALVGGIPKQNAGEKILYFAEIKKNENKYVIPDKPVTLIFKGYVPSTISMLSDFALFGGLLLSFRTALDYFNKNEKIKKLTLFTVATFFVYTVAVTPLRKSYELDAINKKVVPITSLFDLQSILLFILWIAAMIIIFNLKNSKQTAMVFAIAAVVIFLFI